VGWVAASQAGERLANDEEDVVIVEDDPYCMLQFGEYRLGRPTAPAAQTIDVDTFVNLMEKSFLSIDYQGRVIRLDTFSKVSFRSPTRCTSVPSRIRRPSRLVPGSAGSPATRCSPRGSCVAQRSRHSTRQASHR
jgi:hypothetical protein